MYKRQVVDKNNEVSDLVLYALGLKSNSTLSDDMEAFMAQENLRTDKESWTYEDICSRTFRYIYPADEYEYDEDEKEYVKVDDEELGLKTLYKNGLEVKIVGIIRQDEDAMSGMMTGAIGYTHALIEHVVEQAAEKELVKAQLEDPEHDVFNGLPFLDDTDEAFTKNSKIEAAKQYIADATDEELAELYVKYMSVPEDDYVQELIDEQMEDMTRADIEKMVTDYYPGYESMLKKMDDDTLFELSLIHI